MSETNLGSGAGWGKTTADCVVNSYGNVGRGGGGVSVVSMDCGVGMAQLIIVAIFILFFASSPN